jgi:hypothetical protein
LPGLDVDSLGFVPSLNEDDLLILVSHDCDICCPSPDEEPQFEVIAARVITSSETDGNFFHAKNPRRLRFRITGANGEVSYEARMTDRRWIPRGLLADSECRGRRLLDDGTVRVLQWWLAKRYQRMSLPHAFNKRARKAKDYVTTKIKRSHELIRAVRLTISSLDELPEDQEYEIVVFIIVSGKVRDAEYDGTVRAKAAFQNGFSKCAGITCHDAKLVSEAEFSLANLDATVPWEYSDYLSYAEAEE